MIFRDIIYSSQDNIGLFYKDFIVDTSLTGRKSIVMVIKIRESIKPECFYRSGSKKGIKP